MNDADCTSFLQWCLPRMGFRWSGFRKVRRQVCKRLSRRLVELALPDIEAYRAFLSSHPEEWKTLDSLCRVTISRFYRDRVVFDRLRDDVLPELARRALEGGHKSVRCWSAGCASGEEPYTLQIIWRLAVVEDPGCSLPLRTIATDTDPHLLKRARDAVYPPSTLTHLPDEFALRAFDAANGSRVLNLEFRGDVEWLLQDIREESPAGPFDLVLCRNLAFTYFEESVQRNVLKRIHSTMARTAYLIVGSHESPPSATPELFRACGRWFFRKIPTRS